MTQPRPPHIVAQDDEYLRKAWLDCVPTEVIARKLDRPVSYVAARAGRLGVKRPAWYRVLVSQRNGSKSLGELGKWELMDSQGHRMSEEAIAHLYAGRRYDQHEYRDNTVGRLPLRQTYVARQDCLAGAA